MANYGSHIAAIVGLVSALFLCSCFSESQNITNVATDSNAIILNGQRQIIISGSIHYPRSTPEMWPDLIRKAKEGGLDAIQTYIFWNLHEPRHREYDFSGNLDIVSFFKTVQAEGMYAILRIGPYICSEWTYGGFPVWLHNIPGIQFRTDNEPFKKEMQIFTTKIVNICKEAKLFGPQGGPIIFAQIENEYGDIMNSYGQAGISYMNWCAKMATSLDIGVPWIMCQQNNAPPPIINTCNGYYCDRFKPNNPMSPKMWTEHWSGWYWTWGSRQSYRPAEDVAFATARFFQSGGVFMNYYMFHGGTNFRRTPGGPGIITAYSYDAPISEYGTLNQPKYGHLKKLHLIIKSVQDILTDSTIINTQIGNGVEVTTYAKNATGEKVCFLSNVNETQDANIDLKQDGKYFVPAWSVSILDGCNQEIYNTAKVKTQTTTMIKKPNTADPTPLSWTWTPEIINDTLAGNGTFTAQKLLEQKAAATDASDYLWYMTSVDIHDPSWTNATLLVHSYGWLLHVYVNERLIGSEGIQGGKPKLLFGQPVELKMGSNVIALLSVTMGFTNYGAFYDSTPYGIAGGPVLLVGFGNKTMDLSSHNWSYKVGLTGEELQLYTGKSDDFVKWRADNLPISRPLTWYKTTFKAPAGVDPVVVDLEGMGKGEAWVNGHSLGRFWTSLIAPSNGCNPSCDYRGPYRDSKCFTGCGEPSQRWFHIPRSFLNDENNNTLVLFEELGGDLSRFSIQTVSVGAVCGNIYEDNALELSCGENAGQKKISSIQFSSFGNSQEKCESLYDGSSDVTVSNTLSILQEACVGKLSCTVDVSEEILGLSTRENKIKGLAVHATC